MASRNSFFGIGLAIGSPTDLSAKSIRNYQLSNKLKKKKFNYPPKKKQSVSRKQGPNRIPQFLE